MKDDLKTTHGHKNSLVRKFFNKKKEIAIKFAELKEEDIILDFGAGQGYLKQKLNNEVINYDIIPEHSDIKDYTTLKPNKIFALDVFEHLTQEEIKQTILNFKKMNKDFKLITIIPTENFISRKIRRLIGKKEITEDHKTNIKQILNILNKHLDLVKKKNFLTISHIALWKNKQ